MKGKKIAVICAQWHVPMVEAATQSFIHDMEQSGFARAGITIIKVPGSLEIPLYGKKALQDGYDMAVGIGFVVNGGIYRHEFVAQAVLNGIMDVQLETGKPFLSVVLTPITFTEGLDVHEKFFQEHMVLKGREAAHAALSLLGLPESVSKAA